MVIGEEGTEDIEGIMKGLRKVRNLMAYNLYRVRK